MSGNIFGNIITLTSFGESHGKAIGGVVTGIPAGLKIDLAEIQSEVNKRRPGQSPLVTSRNEKDIVEILSGIKNDVTLGTPIGFVIANNDAISSDYSDIENAYRPSHADFTYQSKYGIRDTSGGGRSSARETVSRVVAGAIAKQLLKNFGVNIRAYVNNIGKVSLNKSYLQLDLNTVYNSLVRCPDIETSEKMISLIEETSKNGDTLGGQIVCVIENPPIGLGEPVFNKLNADLGHAMLGINAVKSFEIGSGIASSEMLGSDHNDLFEKEGDRIRTKTNYSGGVQGGISNGEDIYFKVAFKPVATIMKSQKTIDKDGNEVVLKGKGRHDVCVVPRAVPIVEAMAALVIADHLMLSRLSKL